MYVKYLTNNRCSKKIVSYLPFFSLIKKIFFLVNAFHFAQLYYYYHFLNKGPYSINMY